jgi:hypothetical protein
MDRHLCKMLDNVLDDDSTCPFAVVILFFMVADEEMYVWYLSTLYEWSKICFNNK